MQHSPPYSTYQLATCSTAVYVVVGYRPPSEIFRPRAPATFISFTSLYSPGAGEEGEEEKNLNSISHKTKYVAVAAAAAAADSTYNKMMYVRIIHLGPNGRKKNDEEEMLVDG